jgi:hypothetical protein
MLFSPRPEDVPNINEDRLERQALSRTGIPACPASSEPGAVATGPQTWLPQVGPNPVATAPGSDIENGQTGMSVLLDNAGECFQVSDEAMMFEAARVVIRSSQN